MMTNINEFEKNANELPNFNKKKVLKKIQEFSKKYCVANGKDFKLNDFKTEIKFDLGENEKELVQDILKIGVDTISDLQEILYAQDKWSLLIIFQAMDAAGKDGAIKHVMSGINPQGCQVTSFKAPSSEELDHDYLWRCQKHLPERGRIGIFNRSYYEEVLVVRVHEQILKNQKLPSQLISKNIWEERFEDIKNYEKYLNRNGTAIIKIFLNVSKKEQKERLIERIDDEEKNWKFSATDVKERGYWDEYMHAYEELIKNTSTEKSPWYVIPADNKSYARIAIASAIVTALDKLELDFPTVNEDQIAELQLIKKSLLDEI